jgi:hypothetical protein
MNADLEEALVENLKQQKQLRKQRYTRPELFIMIEDFMIKNKLIGYGGMAINALLPADKQFYSDIDVPDYDFFSPTAEKHAIELSNYIYKLNQEVEVKSALFEGTYKIFVNAIPIVDITQIDPDLFINLHKTATRRHGIYYAPYNYLRMSMYQELSRPMGDLSRWQKVYQRLTLLNESHPLLIRRCNVAETNFLNDSQSLIFNKILERTKQFVWLGDHAMYYYQDLFPKRYHTSPQNCLYIQVENEREVWNSLKGINYKLVKHHNKFITFYQVFIQDKCMLYVILTDSCQSYNTINGLKIASYDTMLSIYYMMSFMGHIKEIKVNKLLSYCFLLENIKGNKDVMRRFRMPCNGTQKSYEQIRQERDNKYKIYKKTGKYRHIFFHYKPKTKKSTVIKKYK